MLEINDITKNFAGLCAISRVNVKVEQGRILGLIGPNGAGKTTLFNLITGFTRPSTGDIVYQGQSIVGLKPHRIARLGIGRTFQKARIFPDFTVRENLRASSDQAVRLGLLESVLRTGPCRKKEQLVRSNAEKCAAILGLESWADAKAGVLPHAHQKLLGIAMALAISPRLLLLDEPLEGMNPREVDQTLEIIKHIQSLGITIVLIEHNMRAMMKTCDELVVLNFGQVIAKGGPEYIKKNPEVIEAYLGTAEHA